MGTLFIIGNGFDLHYGLPTRTVDFRNYLKKEKIHNDLKKASEVFSEYGVCWSEFEECLSRIDLHQIEESQLSSPDYAADHEYERDDTIFNMRYHLSSLICAINNALKNMVRNADSIELNKALSFSKDDAIISFNYTTTIERVAFKLPQRHIFYIHGCMRDEDELVYGYSKENGDYDFDKFSHPDDGDYYLEKQLEEMKIFYSKLKKKPKIDELRHFLLLSKEIDKVEVWGHSLGQSDLIYFEEINNLINPLVWKISYYDEDDKVLTNAKSLSFQDKIEWRCWR